MKLLKKLTFVFSLFMGAVLLYVPASAASEDSGNPEVISYTGTTGGNAAAFLKDTSTDHYYKFTIGTTSSYPDTVAVTLAVPDGCDYQMEIDDTANSRIYYGQRSNTSNDKIIRIQKPDATSTYYLHVYSEDGIYANSGIYSIRMRDAWKTSSYTGNFSPTTLTNAGGATLNPVYSTTATIDLSKVTSIPNTAQVTGVSVSGTLSYNIGNTWMEILHGATGNIYEARMIKGYSSTFSDLRNSYEQVKTKWTIAYYTYAGKSTTYSNPKITINYRYDQFEDF